MDRKKLIWLGLAAGSIVGSSIPALWGSSLFSLTSSFLSAIGGLAGIWLGYRLGS